MSRRFPNPIHPPGKKKSGTVRVYQLMRADYALEDLRRRHLKAACFEDLNDPFELLGESLEDPVARRFFQDWKAEMNADYRILCFSRSWSNPLLWSHYADKHRGLALGFDVPEDRIIPIRYAPQRLSRGLRRLDQVPKESLFRLLGMKFRDWAYEDEVRMFIRVQDTYPECTPEGRVDFYPFNNELKLREIIIGPRAGGTNETYQQTAGAIRAAIQNIDQPVDIVRTRLAFRSFKVVANRARQRFSDEEL